MGQDAAGQGWFTYVRLHGPLEPFFEQIWKPDDIIKVEYLEAIILYGEAAGPSMVSNDP